MFFVIPDAPLADTSAPAAPDMTATADLGAPASDMTVFHISQWKAGSQWVQSVFRAAAPERLIEPSIESSKGIFPPIRKGAIYSPVYIHRQAFEESPAAAVEHRKFIVIRDLRDILVSWHKSLLKSHETNDVIEEHREKLRGMDTEQGLLYLLEHQNFYGLAMVAATWIKSKDLVVRYEDLLADQVGGFRQIFDHCGMAISDERLEEIVHRRSFEVVTGRKRGQEAPNSHQRRAVAGDWRNHFSWPVIQAFKKKYSHLLVVSGYEEDGAW
jgi:sulfotransferase family protein